MADDTLLTTEQVSAIIAEVKQYWVDVRKERLVYYLDAEKNNTKVWMLSGYYVETLGVKIELLKDVTKKVIETKGRLPKQEEILAILGDTYSDYASTF